VNRKHIGSSFDEFLEEEGILGVVGAAAAKRVIAYQLEQEMVKRKMTRGELAELMQTSRASLDRLLDEQNTSVTLHTLGRVATILGKKLVVELR